ncbi:MAG: PKD domain-containing protein [Fimbriimonadaceae bacterium]|nr:PKD domain-containing protein [Fimbriimonadaceae bacterium]
MKWITTALAALALMGSAIGQQKLYDGTRALGDQSVAVEGWGSGIITETTEAAFEGTASLRVSTRNFFQGGTIKFGNGVNLASAYGNRSNLLMFVFNLPGASGTATGAGGRTGGPGAGSAGGGGSSSGTADDGGGRPGGGRGGQATTTATNPAGVDRIRVIITTTDGLKSEAYLEMADTVADQRGWRRAGIPLQAITGFARTNKTIQSIALAADEATTFYVGSISILEDSTPITADLPMNDTMNIGTGDTIIFQASGQGGATKLIYEWDFDDKDGIQADAEGRAVRHRFRTPGTYTVTVVVRDAYGLKEPFRRTMTVTVN